MKLLGLLSPGNLDFFFQNQPALGVKHLFDYRYNDRVAFVAHSWHLEDLTTDGNYFKLCLFATKTFVDELFPYPGLPAYSQTSSFHILLYNRKLLREES